MKTWIVSSLEETIWGNSVCIMELYDDNYVDNRLIMGILFLIGLVGILILTFSSAFCLTEEVALIVGFFYVLNLCVSSNSMCLES